MADCGGGSPKGRILRGGTATEGLDGGTAWALLPIITGFIMDQRFGRGTAEREQWVCETEGFKGPNRKQARKEEKAR